MLTLTQTGVNEGMDGGLCHGVWEWWPESGDFFEVVESRFGDGFDVGLEWEGGVQNNTQVADIKGKISNLPEQRLGSHNHKLCFITI